MQRDSMPHGQCHIMWSIDNALTSANMRTHFCILCCADKHKMIGYVFVTWRCSWTCSARWCLRCCACNCCPALLSLRDLPLWRSSATWRSKKGRQTQTNMSDSTFCRGLPSSSLIKDTTRARRAYLRLRLALQNAAPVKPSLLHQKCVFRCHRAP